MLLFYDSRRGGENSKSGFSLACILRLASHEEHLQELRPILSCMTLNISQSIRIIPTAQPSVLHVPSSEYCRATSATASPILCLTKGRFSLCRHSSSFCLMATFWGGCNNMKSSFDSSVPGVFLVFVDILRKRTAAKERVFSRKPCQPGVFCKRSRKRTDAIPMVLGLTGFVQPGP